MIFVASHVVNGYGAPAWTEADAASASAPPLDPGLPVQVLESWGEWARVRCENGWETWTDGRTLRTIAAPTASAPGRTTERSAVIVSFAASVAVVGAFLPWYSGGGFSVNAFDLPLWGLIAHSSSGGGIKAGFVVCLCGLAVVAVRLRVAPVWIVASACTATNPATFGLMRWLFPDGARPTLGIGLILTFAGGATVLYVGGRELATSLKART